MKPYSQMNVEDQIASLEPVVAAAADFLGIEICNYESINHDYNSTFKITCFDGEKWALRININSGKTYENLIAELQVVAVIQSVPTPFPKINSNGESIAKVWHEATGRELLCVAYSWIEGEEVGDEPTQVQLAAMGRAMAKMHIETRETRLLGQAHLPTFDGVVWGQAELLLSTDSGLTMQGRTDVARVYERIEDCVQRLFAGGTPQLIHADIHPWNVIWNAGGLAVFDFDDCGWGFPSQDIATSLYYLDTPEQDAEFLRGYAEVRAVPEHDPEAMKILLLQRRLVLANFLLESTNPEHAEMLPRYLAETERRVAEFLRPELTR